MDNPVVPLQSIENEDFTTVWKETEQDTREENVRYCICQKEYDECIDEMLGCENQSGCLHPTANGWFHYACVGVLKNTFHEMCQSTAITRWYCLDCTNARVSSGRKRKAVTQRKLVNRKNRNST
jgi:hypothetical protein